MEDRKAMIAKGFFVVGHAMLFAGLAGVWMDRYVPGFTTMALGIFLIGIPVLWAADR
jgi:hypothetical protein